MYIHIYTHRHIHIHIHMKRPFPKLIQYWALSFLGQPWPDAALPQPQLGESSAGRFEPRKGRRAMGCYGQPNGVRILLISRRIFNVFTIILILIIGIVIRIRIVIVIVIVLGNLTLGKDDAPWAVMANRMGCAFY